MSKISGGLILFALLAVPMVANGYEISRVAWGSLAGNATSASHALGLTGGLSIMGLSTSASHDEFVGFWIPQSTTTDVNDPDLSLLPRSSLLDQNYPNPFGKETSVRFQIGGADGDRVSTDLEIFDIGGRRVSVLVKEALAPGSYESRWDGRGLDGRPVSNGIYFARLKAGTYEKTIRLVATRQQ